MALPLPPDPYKALGIAKEATLAEIRSAHRKLVLKCHPDKVQDPTLKAQKADEFQKVQQAYELLSDDTKRQDYDEKIRLFSLRDTMRAPMPKAGSYAASTPAGVTVFDFEIRTAEPRSSRFKGARAPSPVRVHAAYGKPRSFEDDLPTRMFEEATRSARKTASYEERKKTSSKEEERRRRAEEERERERWEKEMKKKDLSASRKSRDKERKKGSEEKTSRRTAYIVDDGDDSEGDYQPRVRRSSKKSNEKIRTSSENVRADEISITETTQKYEQHKNIAAQYITKMNAKSPEVEFRPRPVQRAETFQVPPYTSRYPVPPQQPYVEEPEEYVRRSSARPTSRRTSDAPSPRSREPPRTSSGTEPFIVTAEPPSARKPSLQSHSSAPPIIPNTHERKEPQRSHTIQTEYVRRPSAAAPPPIPRAATFNEKTTSRPSHLHKSFRYTSDSASSDSDEEPAYAAPRYASSPPRHKERAPPRSTQYFVEKGRSVPVVRTTHRKTMHDGGFERERSESPRGTHRRLAERPPLTRTPPTSSTRPSSSRAPYYGEEVPIVIPVRPGPPKRDGGASTHGTPRAHAGPFFGEVKFAPRYSPEDVTYSEHYPKHYGRADEARGDYYSSPRRGETAYA